MAQATLGTGVLTGTIPDEQGTAVPGAEVVLTETSKRLTLQPASDSAGNFLFPALTAGSYELEVAKDGLHSTRIRDLHVSVGQQEVVDVVLQVGDLRETVTVSAEQTALVDATSNVIGPVVDSERVSQLPLNGRNFLQLAQLAATAADITEASNVFSSNVGRPGRVVVLPGALPHSVSYTLNGMDIRGSRDGELTANVSVAAIDQFRVQQSFFLPDQGSHSAVVKATLPRRQCLAEIFQRPDAQSMTRPVTPRRLASARFFQGASFPQSA